MKIKNICIVGGGSSGWMTAAALTKLLPQMNVTLIESKNINTVGVGESTLTYLNVFLKLLDLKDEDWMSSCNATYKTSIKFTDFAGKGKNYHYPFGARDFSDAGGIATWYYWKLLDPSIDNYSFAEYYHPVITMSDQNKMTSNEDGAVRAFDFHNATAYHMDATKFGQYLKEKIALPNGLNYITDDVVKVNQNEDGSVKSLSTGENGDLEADLFVDCTGFKALLLNETLKVPFISFSDSLINDKAIATKLPYIDPDKEMECVTNCTAIESGWVWNIPLFNRIGTGYVYSSKFETPESAEKQFRHHLAGGNGNMVIGDKERVDKAEFRHIDIRHGTYETSWKHNVVGVGLSSGFIEPLESTGLLLTHENIIFLLRTLIRKDGQVNKFDRDIWNYSVREKVENMREFVAQHYALSSRHDTPYWKHVTEEMSYDFGPLGIGDVAYPITTSADLVRRLNKTFEFGPDMGGLMYIATGNGYSPCSIMDSLHWEPEQLKHMQEQQAEQKDQYKNFKEKFQVQLDQLPTHYEFLKENIYN
jgi:tryptophan halogenase